MVSHESHGWQVPGGGVQWPTAYPGREAEEVLSEAMNMIYHGSM